MLFALLQWHIAVHSKCLRGGQGSAGTRPQHRCKSGMDGGFTAAILLSPPLHLRTADFLSKRWGPPQTDAFGVEGRLRLAARLEELPPHTRQSVALELVTMDFMEMRPRAP